ncbi:BamA/OMP85 family outer membrane protein [Candidatus Gromoviella agglomerans]|uniref:BamA/OMP85 family outer membrane protein n=1 Tax=Candidatus Gromoviella agglomerans TaxID=2806609 RepID=UPI001E31DF68|nr:BamA/TamA family outer membrane protein [Candidatus Gromoviella agglomerans]UFX98355.1 Outer membrane protein assembly factor BamA precursor [Candidatus Gromoviella agglomerans]
MWYKLFPILLLCVCAKYQTSEGAKHTIDSEKKSLNVNLDNGLKLVITGLKNVSVEWIRNYLRYHNNGSELIINTSESISNMIKSGLFSDAKIAQQGNVVTIELKENVIVGSFRIEGLPVQIRSELSHDIKLPKSGDFFQPRILEEVSKWIVNNLKNRGHINAKVQTKTYIKNGEIHVKISASKGKHLKVRSIRFFGNKHFKDKKLLQISSLSKTNLLTVFTQKDMLSEEKLNNIIEIMQAFYRQEGYFEAKVGIDVILSQNNNIADVICKINEGERFEISEIDILIDGVKNSNSENISQKFAKSKFKIQNVQNIIQEIKKSDKSLLKKEIEWQFDVSTSDKSVKLIFEVENKKNLYIERVIVTGNKSISSYFIRKKAKIYDGMRCKKIDKDSIIRSIMLTGFFTSADVYIQKNKKRKSAIVTISVKEKNILGSISMSGGYGSIDKLFFQGAYETRGEKFSAQLSARFASNIKTFQISIDNNPSITDIGYFGNLSFVMLKRVMFKIIEQKKNSETILEERDMRNTMKNPEIMIHTIPLNEEEKKDKRKTSIDLKKFNASINVAFPISYPMSYGPNLRFSFQTVKIIGDMSDLFMSDTGSFIIMSVGHKFTINTLNSMQIPTKGFLFSFDNSFSFIFKNSGDRRYSPLMKNIFTLSGFIPIDTQHLFVTSLSLQLGLITKLVKDGNIRVFDKFFSSEVTIRGFDEQDGFGPKNLHQGTFESIGGMKFATADFTIWLPITKKLLHTYGVRWFIFINAASIHDSGLELDTVINNDFFIRVACGAGISLRFGPIGSLNVYFSKSLRETDQDTSIMFGINAGILNNS